MSSLNISDEYSVSTVEELEALYGAVNPNALTKEIAHISDHYRAFIEKSPFALVASVSEEGLDCSPRGDPPGFVRIIDEKTVVLPDRRGNNRLDSLKNIVRDPRISLLFLIPGVGETLRINGTARLVTDPELCASFEMQGKSPTCVIVVTVGSIYFQCQKALARSKLWDPSAQIDRSELPSTGTMLQALSEGFDGQAYDDEYPERLKKTIY